MKKNVFCLITVFAVLFTAVSCDKKDDDKTDQVWKLANEQAFNAVKNNPAYTEFKSPGNEGSIYYRVLKKGTGTKQIFYTSTATVYSKGWFAADSKEYGITKGMVFQKWLARRLNDGMGAYIAHQTIKCMNKKGILVKDAEILILGFAFKENCPDTRNTKVTDIHHTLQEYTNRITIYDPWVDSSDVREAYGVDVVTEQPTGKYDAVILAVAHKAFGALDLSGLLKTNAVVYDVRSVLPRETVDGRL